MVPAEERQIQVFLVAEHPDLRQSLGLLLAGEGMTVCGWADRPRAALWKLPAEADVVLIGLSGAGFGGVELLRALGERPESPPALVLSAADDPYSMGLAFAAGAKGYVPNRQACDALPCAIREVVAGRTYIPTPPAGDPRPVEETPFATPSTRTNA